MTLQAAPARILDGDGRPVLGIYRGTIGRADLLWARIPKYPGPLGRLRLKQWEHWLVIHDEIALTVAIVDAVLTRLVWVQVIDRTSGARWEHRREGPRVQASLCASLMDGKSRGKAPGVDVAIRNEVAVGEQRLQLTAVSAGLPDVGADLIADASAAEPLSVVLPVAKGRVMYSHKVPLPVHGTVRVADRLYKLDASRCTAVLDVHKAHYPRDTWWNWASGVGFDARGRRIGFNCTANVVTDPQWHENARWVDGKLELLPTPEFAVGADPWRVKAGDLELAFQGEGERSEDVDYRVLRSQFRQRYGRFSGSIDAFGLFEDHKARW